MLGKCSICGKKVIRKPPVDLAVCKCANPQFNAVPLKLTVSLSNDESEYLEKASQFSGVTVEKLVNAFLIEFAKEQLRMLRPFPQLTVTVRGQRRAIKKR